MVFMLTNLIAFTLIFGVFALVIYNQISGSLFSPVVSDLEGARENILDSPSFVDRQLSVEFPKTDRKQDSQDPPPEGEPAMFDKGGGPHATYSMRVQALVRDGESQVLNPQALGRLAWEQLLEDIPFSTTQGEEGITSFVLGDAPYRSLVFETTDQNGNVYYIQLLANVAAEQTIVDNLKGILLLGGIICVLLSITASSLLAFRTMQPLMRSWRRQTEFVENASHELRTPLTIIQNKLEVLFAHPDASVMDSAEEIGVALSETRRLSKLTGDLMTLARADSDATQLTLAPVAMDALIAHICEPYGELAEMQDKTLTLELNYGQSVQADAARLHELMVIVLDNALKYTGTGDSITVRSYAKEGRAVIEVADTGIGISAESAGRIFERFYREDKARTRENGGSGLGLSIAKWIVSAHGGTIRALPGEQGGTVIRIKL